MGILSLSVKVGEAVQIGEMAFISVGEKSGSRVNLKIATRDPDLRIMRVPSGIIPPAFLPPGLAPAPFTMNVREPV